MLEPELADYLGRAQSLLFPVGSLGEPLPAMLSSVGAETRTGPGYDWHGLRRGGGGNIILQYTLAGQGRLSFDETTHALQPGEALCVYVPHNHRYWVEPGEEWTFFWINCRGSWLNSAWAETAERVQGKISAPPGTRFFEICREILHRTYQGRIKTARDASRLAYELTLELLALAGGAGESHRPGAEASPEIHKALQYLHTHYPENIGVDDLAEAAGLSRYHFSRQFHAETGLPPGEYLIRERLQRAVTLLQSDREPIKTVAQQCGFADANYFSRAFRQRFGLSPREFRANHLHGR